MSLVFRPEKVPAELRTGLREIMACRAGRFAVGKGNGLRLRFVRDRRVGPHGFDIRLERGAAVVSYGSVSCAFRALGALLGSERGSIPRAESSPFTMRGLMIDCSRNGVLRVDAAKHFMRRVALMGVNMIMLYTEDTYQVPGEPFFGYLRGAYTRGELKNLDDYAFALGIELIPCIQTLGHMDQVLQWGPYASLRDSKGILLPGDEGVYRLIRKMVRAASSPLRSKRIHIGMDEALGVGEGRYRRLHGRRAPFDIMNEHLARVRDICLREGLTPMIWSDMYFKLGSKSKQYYDLDWRMPAAARKGLPKNVQFVYWDYYHERTEFYRSMISLHRRLGTEPLMAGGIWTWNVLWCALPWALTAVDACMTACRAEGLKEVFMTMWGDDGMQTDIFSALPGVQYFCEHAFTGPLDMESAKRNFLGSCDARFDDFMRAAEIECTPLVKHPEKRPTNVALGLLWQDPLLAVMDPLTRGADLKTFYRGVARDLSRAGRRGLSARLRFPRLVAEALSLKTHLRRDLARAYRAGNRARLRSIRKRDLPALRSALTRLWKGHREMWMATYKPFGWEVIDRRYGGLRARLDTVGWLLDGYLDGTIERIPELEAVLHNPWPGVRHTVPQVPYGRVATPSCIK